MGDLSNLIAIPLAIAGWLRYLLGVDDEGNKIEISSDPLLPELRKQLESIEFGKPYSYTGQLGPILSNSEIFGSDLVRLGLAPLIETMFTKELNGKGAVRATLREYLK